jgi:hypothetical protein
MTFYKCNLCKKEYTDNGMSKPFISEHNKENLGKYCLACYLKKKITNDQSNSKWNPIKNPINNSIIKKKTLDDNLHKLANNPNLNNCDILSVEEIDTILNNIMDILFSQFNLKTLLNGMKEENLLIYRNDWYIK